MAYIKIDSDTFDQLLNKLDESEQLLGDLEDMAFFRDGSNSSFNDLKERFDFISETFRDLEGDGGLEMIECESINDEFKFEIAMRLAQSFSLEEMFRLEKQLNKQ